MGVPSKTPAPAAVRQVSGFRCHFAVGDNGAKQFIVGRAPWDGGPVVESITLEDNGNVTVRFENRTVFTITPFGWAGGAQ